MSQDIYVFLNKRDLPPVKLWQSALGELGTSVIFNDGFDPFKDTGYVPCRVGTASAGFEFFIEAGDDVLADYPQLTDKVRQYDTVAIFSWGGDLQECIVALGAAATLTAVTRGIMYDPQEDERFDVPEARAYALRVAAEIGQA